MNELERLFNSREISMLMYALSYAILEEKHCLEVYEKCDSDRALAKETADNLSVLKSLYRRFFPNLSDELLFGSEDDEK